MAHKQHTKSTFIKGAMLLSIATILVKILGGFFRIPLANIIGDEGMAYYQAVYPIYNIFYILATLGIPVAISKLISEKVAIHDYDGAKRIFKTSMATFLMLGIVLFLLIFFLSDTIISFTNNLDDASIALKAIAPSLVFAALNTIFRGYFQGLLDMKPTAVSEIVEQGARVLFGLFLALIFIKDLPVAVAGATFGACAGSIFSLLILIIIYKRKCNDLFVSKDENIEHNFPVETRSRIITSILHISLPVALGSLIMPIMSYIDAVLVTNRLSNLPDFSPQIVRELFGQLSGFASPIASLPYTIIIPLAIGLVPAISSAKKLGDTELFHHNITLSLRATTIIILPASAGLFFLATPIMSVLYPLQEKAALNSAELLKILSFNLIFISLVSVLTAILQGLGKQYIPVFALLSAFIVKIILTYILTGIPALNVKGAAIATFFTSIVALSIDFAFMLSYTKTKIHYYKVFLLPFISSIIMGIFAYFTYNGFLYIFSDEYKFKLISLFLSVLLSIILYLVIMLLTKGITKEDKELLKKEKDLTVDNTID